MLQYVVRPAIRTAGDELGSPDPLILSGAVTPEVIRQVLDAPVVIADLTGAHPGVMYLLALRHATARPVLHIVAGLHPVPLDVAGLHVVRVDLDDIPSVGRASLALADALRALEQGFRGPASPIVEVAAKARSEQSAGAAQSSRRIFVVHGHDGELKNELARLLEKLQLTPVILQEQADRGQTLFAKLHGELADVRFAFILLTPDDEGKALFEPHLHPRARQNVILEHGLLLGRLGPERVCAIMRGEVELPSDLYGVLPKKVPQGGSLSFIAFELIKELRAAGYDVDANRLGLL
jgi:predicted nucleotide-binding protein